MLNIKHFSVCTLSVFMLLSLSGCGDGASCCKGPALILSENPTTAEKNIVDIGVKGEVDAFTPTALTPLNVNASLPPSATILVNGCDKEHVVQGCKATHFEVQSNDPDGNNDNLTFAWTLDDILISDKQSFCHKVEGLGVHHVKVVVTDEENATATDILEVLVK